MREVLSNAVWIGNAVDARDAATILGRGIAAVVDLAMEEPAAQLPREIVYCRFPLVDGGGNLPNILAAAFETTARLIQLELTTLVACSGGMSRAPAVVAAAIAIAEQTTADAALMRITQSGPHDVSGALWSDIQEALSKFLPR